VKRGIDWDVDKDRVARDIFAFLSNVCVVVAARLDLGDAIGLIVLIELDLPNYDLHLRQNQVTGSTDREIGRNTNAGDWSARDFGGERKPDGLSVAARKIA
jgi:hypothetical protein